MNIYIFYLILILHNNIKSILNMMQEKSLLLFNVDNNQYDGTINTIPYLEFYLL